MHSIHPHTVAIQNQAIGCLKSIYDEVSNRNRWQMDEHGYHYEMKRLVSPYRSNLTEEQNLGIDLIYNCYERYLRHMDDLRSYERGEGHSVYTSF